MRAHDELKIKICTAEPWKRLKEPISIPYCSACLLYEHFSLRRNGSDQGIWKNPQETIYNSI